MKREVCRFPIDHVREVLLHGEGEQWQAVTKMEEVLVRVSSVDGPAGLPGFRIEYQDGTVAGVTASTVAGVKV